jgi:hypothetical protein
MEGKMKFQQAGAPIQASVGVNSGKMVARILAQAVVMGFLLALLLFLSAGRLDWAAGWILMALFLLGNFGVLLVLLKVDPGLAQERIEVPGEIKPWDRVLTGVPKVLLLVVMLPLAGLDLRFRWSQSFPAALQAAALPSLACRSFGSAGPCSPTGFLPLLYASRPSAAMRWLPEAPTGGCATRATWG